MRCRARGADAEDDVVLIDRLEIAPLVRGLRGNAALAEFITPAADAFARLDSVTRARGGSPVSNRPRPPSCAV